MAPTEVLAGQHARSVAALPEGSAASISWTRSLDADGQGSLLAPLEAAPPDGTVTDP